jgi:hypothetical protein
LEVFLEMTTRVLSLPGNRNDSFRRRLALNAGIRGGEAKDIDRDELLASLPSVHAINPHVCCTVGLVETFCRICPKEDAKVGIEMCFVLRFSLFLFLF